LVAAAMEAAMVLAGSGVAAREEATAVESLAAAAI
jgi:hypothetical protein